MIRTDSGYSAELEVTSIKAGDILVDLYSVLIGGLEKTIVSKLFLPGVDVYITGEEPVYVYAEITKIKGTDTAGNQFECQINKKVTTTYQKQYNAWQEEMLRIQNQYGVVYCPVDAWCQVGGDAARVDDLVYQQQYCRRIKRWMDKLNKGYMTLDQPCVEVRQARIEEYLK